jgi:hypothetical protein
MKPFGDAFVKLIKMVIAPVIFCTVVTGIAGMESRRRLPPRARPESRDRRSCPRRVALR